MKKIYLAIALAVLALAAFWQSPENKEEVLRRVRLHYFCEKNEVRRVAFCGEYLKTASADKTVRYYKKYLEIHCDRDGETKEDCQNIAAPICEAEIICPEKDD
jgi:hypothetical protein